MTEQQVDRMRDDFRVVVRDRKAAGFWSDDDKAEIEGLIREAIANRGSDDGLAQCWADWLAGEAAAIRQRQQAVRDAEERMRKANRQQREEVTPCQ